ncbi:MAG: YjbQ family protein, partial [Geminicoccaceae bacterium]
MRQSRKRLDVRTTGQGLYEITGQVRAFADAAAIQTGILSVFIHHTSASLVIQENADPTVQED